MAKKVKKTKRSGIQKVTDTDKVVMDCMVAIAKTNERIDRLVEAIDKSKKVKGL